MKNITFFFLLLLISFSANAQVTFDWEAQPISEGNNLKGMNVVNDTTTILVGYGRTFVVSPDKGQTWDKVRLIDPEYRFEDLDINSSGLGFACAGDDKVIDNPTGGEADVYADGVLLKTTDHGATWTVMDITELGSGEDHTEYPNSDGCYSMHFRSVEVLENNTIFLGVEWYFHESETASRLSFGGVLKSTDGLNWTAVTDNGYYPLSIEAGSSSVYYGGLNHLFKGQADGETVTDIYPNLTAAAADETVFIYDFAIVDENEVYVVTSTNGIYLTEDQGATFTKLENGAPTGGYDMIVVNDTVRMVLGTSTKSKVTRDDGLTWEDCYPGASCYEIGGIMNGVIIGLGKSSIYKISVTDLLAGTYNWSSQEISNGNNLQKMYVKDDNNAIIAGYGTTLVSTSDGGVNWTAIETPELFIYGAEYDFSSVSTAGKASYTCTRRMYMVDFPTSSPYSDVYGHGLIYRSMDYWQTWELLDQGNIGTGTDQAFNPNAEGCYGMSPTEITCVNDTIVYTYVTWLDTIAGIDNKLTHSNVFRTEDGGDSWVPLFEDFKSYYVNSLHFLDEDNGFIVGNSILRKTEDGGSSFIDLYPALQTTASPGDSTIFLYGIDYVDETTWYLNSSTNGLFVTTDGGTSYSKLPGIAGSGGMKVLNDTTIIALGGSTKSKISWDAGNSWTDCYPGSTIWTIGGILDNKLVALAKTNLYKIPLTDLEPPSSDADIVAFVLAEQTKEAVIDPGNNTVKIEVEQGTNVTALTPTITVSDGAKILPASGVEQDFSETVTYTVTAEDTKTSEEWTVIVTIAVGIEDRGMDQITLYPNPANEKLIISHLERIDRITIFSITGSSVLALENPSDRTEVNLAALENGIYFISFLNKEGTSINRKFVINK